MKNLAYLTLGWLLGLFGPWLTDLIQRPFRRAQIRRSLFIELNGLRYKLGSVVFVIASHLGSVDRQLLEWLEPIMNSGETDYDNILPPNALKSLLTLSDTEIQQLASSSPSRGDSLNLKHYDDPFLSASISSLSLFSPEFQRLALGIHSQLALINEEIDVAKGSLEKTFVPSLNEATHAAIRSNLTVSYSHISSQSRRLVDLIGLILEKKKQVFLPERSKHFQLTAL